jgi:hypothetical protein
VQTKAPDPPPIPTARRRRLAWHAVSLAAIYLLFLILLFGLAQPVLACIWILAGLAADLLTWRAWLGSPRTEEAEALTKALLAVLEAQSAALAEQARQIARLGAAVTDDALQATVLGELDSETQPNLRALAEDLAQAEQTLPEGARQTRVWLTEARRLARAAQADVDAIRLQVAGR